MAWYRFDIEKVNIWFGLIKKTKYTHGIVYNMYYRSWFEKNKDMLGFIKCILFNVNPVGFAKIVVLYVSICFEDKHAKEQQH